MFPTTTLLFSTTHTLPPLLLSISLGLYHYPWAFITACLPICLYHWLYHWLYHSNTTLIPLAFARSLPSCPTMFGSMPCCCLICLAGGLSLHLYHIHTITLLSIHIILIHIPFHLFLYISISGYTDILFPTVGTLSQGLTRLYHYADTFGIRRIAGYQVVYVLRGTFLYKFLI